MWRMKVSVVSVVVLGALLFGAVVAYAGWGWNAKVDVGGTTIRTAWTTQHNHSGSSDSSAKITVVVPIEAKGSVSVVEFAGNESVDVMYSDALQCTENGIQTTVKYLVSHSGDGTVKDRVRVVVSSMENQQRLASASGVLGETISVNVEIDGECSG